MKSPIAYMAGNGVAANLLMVFFLVAGGISAFTLNQEVTPDINLGIVEVRVPYPGASPEEIEDAIVQPIEERIRGIQGIRTVRGTAAQGVGVVLAELRLGADTAQKRDEIQAEVDRITSFPGEADEPIVQELTNRTRVLAVALHGDVPQRSLKEIAYRLEDELSLLSGVSLTQVTGARDYQISIEISRDRLRAYDLSLPQLARIIRDNSLDLPAGDIESDQQEVVIKVEGENEVYREFAELVVLATGDGAVVRLEDIAQVDDGFTDTALANRLDGEPVVFVEVYGGESARVLDIAGRVETFLDEEFQATLPTGVETLIWRNQAEQLRSRVNLLLKNAAIGFLLVAVALTLFLHPRLAFWTATGIMLAVVGTVAVMVLLDVSINQLSLFGFILALGIIVDDAIVVGENVYAVQEGGQEGVEAAVAGARRVAKPVIFAVATTIAAFLPLLFLPGSIGKFLVDIPTIVISLLALSLVESLLILPHHLSGRRREGRRGRLRRGMDRLRGGVDGRLRRFTDGPLTRALRFAVAAPLAVVAGGLAFVMIAVSLVMAQYIRFEFFPTIESEYVLSAFTLPAGATGAQTRELADYLAASARAAGVALAEEESAGNPIRRIHLNVGQSRPSGSGGPDRGNLGITRANQGYVQVQLSDPTDRELSATAFRDRWREMAAQLPRLQEISFSASLVGFGADVQIQLSAGDEAALTQAVADLKTALGQQSGVYNVRDDQNAGQREAQVRLTPEGRVYGLSLNDLAQQIRGAYFGVEALRVQRDEEEVRVYVRLPEDERDSLADLRDYRIRPPGGGEIPLSQVATIRFDEQPTTITRKNGRRIVTVLADVDQATATSNQVVQRVRDDALPELRETFPDLRVSYGGEQEEQRTILPALFRNVVLALFGIYTLLAVSFRSYVQPLVVMSAIPFGLVGVLFGHLLLGLDVTFLSVFGLIGLSGVIINDSLVMMDFINENRREGMDMDDAIVEGAKSRFRPILLTSLTTFLGVSPLILEQSVQAQFLVPVAVSLGFGVVFGTAILMLFVPAVAKGHFRGEARWREYRERRRAARRREAAEMGGR